MTVSVFRDDTGGLPVYPILVDGFSATRESGNILHRILNAETPAVVFGTTGLRSGTLRYLVRDYAAAQELEDLHAGPFRLNLIDTDVPLTLRYVASGDVVSELDDESRTLWTVSVDFQEVV